MNIWITNNIPTNYDQPKNNLVAWWKEKPDFHTLAKAMGETFTTDTSILRVVHCHQGRVDIPGQEIWELREVEEGMLS